MMVHPTCAHSLCTKQAPLVLAPTPWAHVAGHVPAPAQQCVRSELLSWAGHHHQVHENIYIVEVREPNSTFRVARHLPLATSHTRTEISKLELAIKAPSGLNATPVTLCEWPCKRSIITGCMM